MDGAAMAGTAGVGASPKIRGYTDKQSVAQGHGLRFCIANLSGPDVLQLPIRIVRLGLDEPTVALGRATARPHAIPTHRAWEGSNWEVGYELDVGRDWTSGIYAARVGEGTADSPDIFFIVRNARPGSTSPMVVQIPTTTINAYNNWGGASLYGYNSSSSPASAVSFNRPQYFDAIWKRGYGFADEWNARIKSFVRWMEAAGYVTDFITNNDLHEEGELLLNYQLFISIGHDEYWTREMREHFDKFIASGGNAAIFGGNTCYWQIRFEPDEKTGTANRRQVCHKKADSDPVEDPSLKTVTWREVGYPENRSFGAGYCDRVGAWKGSGEPKPFKVCRPEHWAFYQTGLREGDAFGNDDEETLLCYETNGVDYVMDGGRPVPTGKDGTPMNYLILALAELPDWQAPGNAAIGVFTNVLAGGTVFNAATTDWARGLEPCVQHCALLRTVTAKMTRNVIEHLTPARYACERVTIDGGGISHVYRPRSSDRPAAAGMAPLTSFKVYTAPIDADLVPIHRFRIGPPVIERLSQSPARRGWEPDGIPFYAYSAPADDRIPIYRVRFDDTANRRHERYSSSRSVAKGETLAGIAFYAAK
jgi:hypothetical protein